MDSITTTIATRDTRCVLEQALAYGVSNDILSSNDLSRMQEEGARALVQIANYFGTAYLRENLETALERFKNLASLYLEDKFGSDLAGAARSLRDQTLLSHSRGGSEMLKRLQALPDSTHLSRHPLAQEDQKRFLDERSFATPMKAAEYRNLWAKRNELQNQIAFANWLGKRFGSDEKHLSDSTAEQVIRSAILVCHCGRSPLRFPTRTGMAMLISELRNKKFRPNSNLWANLMRDGAPDYQRVGEAALSDFLNSYLPKLLSPKGSVDDLISGDGGGSYYIESNLQEDSSVYERIARSEWYKVTRGREDPNLLPTVFLSISAKMKPKRSLLLREAKELIASVRENGFDSKAVDSFIENFAPNDQREQFLDLWKNDLLPEAETYLIPWKDAQDKDKASKELDDDDHYDRRMIRALAYLKENCIAKWK